MVTGPKFEQIDEYSTRLRAFTAYDESSVRREEEGFYSPCGQAFIRTSTK